MKCYLAVAYRWGWTNNHQYFVGCWTDKETAISFAMRESEERGGKYGVTVYEFDGDAECEVFHSPSSYGETTSHFNERIELFERFGNLFVPILQGEIEGDVSIEEMKRVIEHEKKILKIMYEAATADIVTPNPETM